MRGEDRERWDRRHSGEFELPTGASALLERYIDDLPRGRALDVATGTGRNALFLADRGFEADAIDISRVALMKARKAAAVRSVSVNWIQADLDEYVFPENAYDVITVSFYYFPDRLADLIAALASDGVLLYEHAVKSTDPVDYGPSDRYRYDSNELLRAARHLTVLYYEEVTEEIDQKTAATARLVARNSTGAAQRYPRR